MASITPLAGPRSGGSVAVPVDHHAVLVPLDGSALSEHAIEPARWLAAHLGGEVHTVVVGYVDDPGWYAAYLRSLRRRWPQLVPHFVGSLDVPGGIVATARRLPGCLVCMGTHGRARTAALLGSTFTDVARAGLVPLVAIGPNAGVPPSDAHRVVACVDGSAAAEQVLPLAAGWAERLDALLDVLVVVEPTVALPTHAERHRPAPLLDPTSYVKGLARRLESCGVAAEGHVAFDALGPEQGLADHLRDHPATLVATTSHLRTWLDRAVHGSAAARIICGCPVPVLVQPTSDAMTDPMSDPI